MNLREKTFISVYPGVEWVLGVVKSFSANFGVIKVFDAILWGHENGAMRFLGLPNNAMKYFEVRNSSRSKGKKTKKTKIYPPQELEPAYLCPKMAYTSQKGPFGTFSGPEMRCFR